MISLQPSDYPYSGVGITGDLIGKSLRERADHEMPKVTATSTNSRQLNGFMTWLLALIEN